MSVNLHLSIRVTGYDPARREAVKQAVQRIVEHESIESDLPPLNEADEGGNPVLVTRSNPKYPVIISSSYKWVPEVQAALSRAAAEANLAPCTVTFEAIDADDSGDGDIEDDEEDE